MPKDNMYMREYRERQTANGGGLKYLKKLAKDGTMPKTIYADMRTSEGYNKVYEAIDKSYKWPDSNYLEKTGIKPYDSWKVVRDKKTGEYYFKTGFNNWAPLGSSREAREGMLKFDLYWRLSHAGKLDKREFIK